MSYLPNRRNFLKSTTYGTLGAAGAALPLFSTPNPVYAQSDPSELNIIGPKKGYTPQIGTMVSMMNWMRNTILRPVRGMTTEQLDYLHDDNSNSIGAMLLHLAATERFYQLNTFDNLTWGEWPKKDADEWDVPMGLGDAGRTQIKGHSLDFYLDKLESVRTETLRQFAERDDEWLLSVDKTWFWGPTNNYCKWFHVCEHESNHNGQIKYIKSRAV